MFNTVFVFLGFMVYLGCVYLGIFRVCLFRVFILYFLILIFVSCKAKTITIPIFNTVYLCLFRFHVNAVLIIGICSQFLPFSVLLQLTLFLSVKIKF